MGRTVYYDHNGKEVEPPKADAVKPTNADKIRAMTDEELAVLLEGCICPVEPCKRTVNRERTPDKQMCTKCWLDWLKEEAEK